MAGREASHRVVMAAAVVGRGRGSRTAGAEAGAMAAVAGGFVAVAAVAAVARSLLVPELSTWRGRECDRRNSSRR